MTTETIPGFPAWFYGPKGEAEVFQSPEQVPEGWADAPFPVEEAVAEEEAPAPAPEFDHDGDGKPGGAVAPEPTDNLKTLRDEYKALFGKKPFAGWDEEELTKRIIEHTPEPEIDPEPDVSEF